MDIWRFVGLICIVACVGQSNANSDPLDLFPVFDATEHIPGEPLSPIDFQNAEGMMNLQPPNDAKHGDPIELAGLYEGDIIIPNSGNGTKNAIINERQKWPGSTVPYVIAAQFNQNERAVIARAISEYHSKTCIKFKPRTTESDYIHIMKGQGCSSHVGRSGGAQPVSLGSGCVYPGIAMHEFMHAVGFWHEQSRADRDEFVTVYFQNIQSGMEFNFNKYSWNNIQNLSAPYDTGSVMHYGMYAFSRDRRQPTIVPKNPHDKIGQREGFSKTDLFKINRLYRCKGEGQVGPTAPPTPAPTHKPPGNKCVDTHKDCSYWAGIGECKKNPSWMLINCKKACDVCDSGCIDVNQHCEIWANEGECSKNPDYMHHSCSKSCKTCSTQLQLSTTPDPTLPMECVDKNRHCAKWAASGECVKNSKYMTKYCPKSCNVCVE